MTDILLSFINFLGYSPKRTSVKCTNHEAPRYVLFFRLPLLPLRRIHIFSSAIFQQRTWA